MSSTTSLSLLLLLFSLLLFTSPLISALNQDGVLLLSFKHSILNDPLSALSNWNFNDDTPCSWNGVMCMGFLDHPPTLINSTTTTSTSRVISLVLPNSQLLGSIAPDVGLIDHLRHLDLSDNLLNGTLPASLFNSSSSSELKILSLANNEISGEIPDTFGNATALKLLNLSDNALTGTMPASLPLLPNIFVLSLRNNFLSGTLPAGGGFAQLQLLDLSSNLFNGSLPADLVSNHSTSTVRYLNLSSNRFSGEIPSELGTRMPATAVVDFSFNNLTGAIPNAAAFLSQKPAAFAGNPDLCGKPLRNYCVIPSTLSNPPNVSTTAAHPPEAPPAFAAIPKTTMDRGGDSSEAVSGPGSTGRGGGFTPATIVAIVIGDLGGVGLLVVAFLYAYHVKKRKQQKGVEVKTAPATAAAAAVPPPCESKAHGGLSCCLRKKDNYGQEESTETSSSSETEEEEEEEEEEEGKGARSTQGKQRRATLVTVDGDTELEVETLLKAAAYIVGATGTTIVYKAVLSDGTALAVRRIGDCGDAVEKLKDFKVLVRSIARVRHPNVLRIWGFYWGPDEKLLIHDYAANGSLANISLGKKMGSSPFNLNWEARLKIARGVARGLAYIHEKKSVHGNIKPSNILLDSDMEAKIGDFGLDRLLSGSGGRPGTSARLFGSKRSMHSQSSLPESSSVPGASPLGCSVNVAGSSSSAPYQAPELLKNLKPNAKCDVYSFGMVLLELVSGRVFSEEELSQWNAGAVVVEERNRILRMADPALRGEVGGREEALLSCFKLGFTCAAAAPQRRPTMKDAVVFLDRLPSSSSTSSLLY